MSTGTTKMDVTLAQDVTSAGAQTAKGLYGYGVDDMSFQITVSGTGSVTAAGSIEVSNDNVGWLSDTNSQFTLSGTNVATTGFTSSRQWKYARLNLSSITGTGAKVTATVAG